MQRFPETALIAEVVPVHYRNVPSTNIAFPEWQELVRLCERLVADHADLAGIVIGHGTASLEETAYALSLTLKVSVPVVVVGSQRPASALSTDAGLNLVNAIRVAASPDARGLGVLVVLNDEIQAAREVSKTSTMRMQTFRTADFGVLGHADGDAVAFYRRPLRRCYPQTEFDIRTCRRCHGWISRWLMPGRTAPRCAHSSRLGRRVLSRPVSRQALHRPVISRR